MAELYAICRIGGVPIVKRVMLTDAVRQQVAQIFLSQEQSFLSGVHTEIDFDGSWKPDADELLVANQVPDVQVLQNAIALNPIALPSVDAGNFESENIRGLVAVVGNGQNRRALVQAFGPQLVLAKKFTLLFSDGVFRQITEPGFSLDSSLVGIIDRTGALKFKSYFLIRRIFDLAEIYREATHPELVAFCAHNRLSVANHDDFADEADEGIRKLVHAVTESGVLDNNTVSTIRNRARGIGFSLQVAAGRIVMPSDRKSKKALLSFLLNKVYKGPISLELLITNSNRRLT